MPSITGIESKITEVLKHVPDDLDTQARFSELRVNMVRFKSDIETREQAERRIVVDVLDAINHSSCAVCTTLRLAL